MFIGEYQHTIDPKGRVIMPSKFREDLGDKFIVTKGLDNCLFVYPQKEWQSFEQKLRSLPLTSRDARAFTRFFSPVRLNVNWINREEFLYQPISESMLN